MNRTPLVSVITPSFNSEHFIEETYTCLAEQSVSDWEWLVTDDGSTDGAPEILKRLAAGDSRVKLELKGINSGPAVARNCSIERSSGRYIAFLDADDQWLPNKLEYQVGFMQQHMHVFTHTWYQTINIEGTPVGDLIKPPSRLSYQDMLKSNQIGCLTAIYDSEQLGKVYMPLIMKRQDYALWLKVLKMTEYVYCLPQCLALYRTGMSSISSNKIDLLKYNWQLFRDVEQFSIPKSAYYLGWNIFRKLKR